MPVSLGFWEWRCPKLGDAHITVTPDSNLVPRAFAVEIKANEAKEKSINKTIFQSVQIEPLLGLKFPPYFLSDAKQAV